VNQRECNFCFIAVKVSRHPYGIESVVQYVTANIAPVAQQFSLYKHGQNYLVRE
jgi:hypothetical protein